MNDESATMALIQRKKKANLFWSVCCFENVYCSAFEHCKCCPKLPRLCWRPAVDPFWKKWRVVVHPSHCCCYCCCCSRHGGLVRQLPWKTWGVLLRDDQCEEVDAITWRMAKMDWTDEAILSRAKCYWILVHANLFDPVHESSPAW